MFLAYMTYLQEKGRTHDTLIAYTNDLHCFFTKRNVQPDEFVTAADIHKWIDDMLHPTDSRPKAVTKLLKRFLLLGRKKQAAQSHDGYSRCTLCR